MLIEMRSGFKGLDVVFVSLNYTDTVEILEFLKGSEVFKKLDILNKKLRINKVKDKHEFCFHKGVIEWNIPNAIEILLINSIADIHTRRLPCHYYFELQRPVDTLYFSYMENH